MKFLSTNLVIVLLALCSCSSAVTHADTITDFESCVAAGNKVLRSYPAKCAAPGIGTFTQVIEESDEAVVPKISEPLRIDSGCKDTCGDGECAEMVCQAIGCPCAESAETCPQDCK